METESKAAIPAILVSGHGQAVQPLEDSISIGMALLLQAAHVISKSAKGRGVMEKDTYSEWAVIFVNFQEGLLSFIACFSSRRTQVHEQGSPIGFPMSPAPIQIQAQAASTLNCKKIIHRPSNHNENVKLSPGQART